VVPHPDWIIPDWPVPAQVRALCTTRAGGVSAAPFDGLNLGDHVGDQPASVAANRARLHAALGARPVFLRQVHGWQVVGLDATTPDGAEADAATTTQPGLACTVMVADCLPVLLADRQGTRVAAAHAGWRGLAGQGGADGRGGFGVLEAVVQSFWPLPIVERSSSAIKSKSNELVAWLGPCIGPQAFEVGPEVREAFVAAQPAAQTCFRPTGGGTFLADLAGLARQRLQALGVVSVHGNDGSPGWCTVTNASRFFSHRRDSVRLGGSGRFAASVWLA
jgi:hypothetical protein